MGTDMVTALAERQEWTTPVEEGLQKAVSAAYQGMGPAGRVVENALHGTWMRHPLHPAVTDVPLGAWTVAVALDAADAVRGDDKYADGADAAVVVGLVGAVGSALTGLTDWHKTDGKARRLGLVHGLLNVGVTALFTASWALRRSGNRDAGKACSLAGFLVSGVSAYLGGSLVNVEKIGVDHGDRRPLPDDFVPVMPEAELPENTLRRVEVEGIKVLLLRRGLHIHAMGEVCSHLGGPLAEGTIEGDSVRCPWHGSRFALEDGRVLDGPSTYPQPCFEARVQNGRIEVRAPRSHEG
jgi:nitrite reductase/ring-hydroxylating ferredoxin subunit/uncharacterized membrane protein